MYFHFGDHSGRPLCKYKSSFSIALCANISIERYLHYPEASRQHPGVQLGVPIAKRGAFRQEANKKPRSSAWPSEARPSPREARHRAKRGRRRRRPAPEAPPSFARASNESLRRPNWKRRDRSRVKRGLIFSVFVGTARSCFVFRRGRPRLSEAGPSKFATLFRYIWDRGKRTLFYMFLYILMSG